MTELMHPESAAAVPANELERLVNLSRDGNERARDIVCAQLLPTVRAAVIQHEYDPVLWDDHIQTTMHNLVRTYLLPANPDTASEAPRPQFSGNMYALASVAAVRSIITYLRKGRTAEGQTRSIPVDPTTFWTDFDSAIEDIDGSSSIGRIHAMLTNAGCAPAMAQAIILQHIQGYSNEEAAAIMGIKPATARTRAHRGLIILREALGVVPGMRPSYEILDKISDRPAASQASKQS